MRQRKTLLPLSERNKKRVRQKFLSNSFFIYSSAAASPPPASTEPPPVSPPAGAGSTLPPPASPPALPPTSTPPPGVTGSSAIGYRFQKPSSTSYTISRVVCNDNNYGFVNTKVDNINAAGITPNFEYIFIDGNLYNLNENNTKGSLVKSNIYQVTGNNNIFRWITDQYLIYNNRLYKWDYEELTLTDVGTAYSYSGDIADTPTGYYVCVEGSFITDNLTKVIFPIKSSFMIGFYYNNVLYTSKDISVISDQNVLDGYIGYNAGLQKIVGTMPNNGQLNYTPSTLPQTIPAGYTSGGTIEAVTMSEEDIENAIAQAEDILD